LKYPDRVLDAWVEDHWQVAYDSFHHLKTVHDRTIHLLLPVRLGDRVLPDLQPQDLAPTFARKPAILVITAAGGAGKTSWACQVARWGLHKQLAHHRLIPLLLEADLGNNPSRVETLRGLLSTLTHQSDPLPVELVEHLWHRQRLLVIADHRVMEMGATTPEVISAPQALVLTAPPAENHGLGTLPHTTLRPLPIEPKGLWSFMSTYLEVRAKQDPQGANLVDLFEEDDYALGSDRLRRLTADQPLTPLLACLYLNQMIQERQGAGGILPDSVPRLMLSYLAQINRTIEPAQQRQDQAVQRDAKAVAWACLENTYRPSWITRETAIAALARVDDGAVEERFRYLRDRLSFLQPSDPGDRLRVILDPLAEYLAAAYLVEQLGASEDPATAWEQFLSQDLPAKLTQTEATPTMVKGFILALRDCYLDQAREDDGPTAVADRLARTVDLDPEAWRRRQERHQIRRLIAELASPNLQDRLRATQALTRYGTAAQIAEPNLTGLLKNRRQQPPEARQAAAAALGTLQLGKDSLQTLLENPEEDLAVRGSAALALGQMGTSRDMLLSLLEADHQPLPLRQAASRALGLIGGPSGQPLPMLALGWEGAEGVARVINLPLWREPLPLDQNLDMMATPAGEFIMGSPPGESGRDVYPSFYPDTEGVDVEIQHPVTVSALMISQCPITQAQWRAVATLARVNVDLNPEPAQFKGDQRPVECVNWHEAVEFCDRLAQYTGKPYRLPSEAEWEYACRAGTNTPFYMGDTLSTQWVNYNGNYVYGPGQKGDFRSETSPVGSFGVNSWGLADMHGNVYEWCLDYWHPCYAGAPTDGSAWLMGGNPNRRILRGGSWSSLPEHCRSGFRYCYNPSTRSYFLGFRVVYATAPT
jgi:formylglycine-generating enzyme required for sulfatase activity